MTQQYKLGQTTLSNIVTLCSELIQSLWSHPGTIQNSQLPNSSLEWRRTREENFTPLSYVCVCSCTPALRSWVRVREVREGPLSEAIPPKWSNFRCFGFHWRLVLDMIMNVLKLGKCYAHQSLKVYSINVYSTTEYHPLLFVYKKCDRD